MDHEAYENEMMAAINRHGEEAKPINEAKWSQVVNKNDSNIVAIGLKRTLLALLTAALFVISIVGFIAVASAPGYLAVILFFASVLAMVSSFVLLYAQGIALSERQGDGK
jgi:hypothetical protein